MIDLVVGLSLTGGPGVFMNVMMWEQKNKTWGKNYQNIETFLGGTRSTEAWKILKKNTKIQNISFRSLEGICSVSSN
jgi:hypothetical protein